MIVLSFISNILLKIIYFFIKLIPTSNKIVMISSVNDNRSIDFYLLEEKLKAKYKIVSLSKIYDINTNYSFLYKTKYFLHSIKIMYHLSTSKVCLVDSYCPVVSILNHKNSLTVIQIGNYSGIFKKKGYSTINKKEGITKTKANTMKLHNNYDIILSSSKNCNDVLIKQYNTSQNNIKIGTLPRFDLLNDFKFEENIKEKIFEKYPILKNKENIIYAPMLRIDKNKFLIHLNELIDKIDLTKYNLIVKLHPLMNISISNDNVIIDNDFSTFEMLFVSNKMITDYSSIIFEAGARGIPLYFYSYDLGYFKYTCGLEIDYKELPGYIEKDANELIKDFDKEYNTKYLKEFIKKYVSNTTNCTDKLADLVSSFMDRR